MAKRRHRTRRRAPSRRHPHKPRPGSALAFALIGSVLLGSAVWWLQAQRHRNGLNAPVEAARIDAARISLGARLYAGHCARCHGVDLEGQPDWRSRLADGSYRAPPHDETGHTWHHPDSWLLWVVEQGGQAVAGSRRSNMPGFSGVLSEEEIRAVLAFIKSRWPPEIRRQQERTTRRGG